MAGVIVEGSVVCMAIGNAEIIFKDEPKRSAGGFRNVKKNNHYNAVQVISNLIPVQSFP
jgi:hypothetical protein